jgi:lipoprotein NlpD
VLPGAENAGKPGYYTVKSGDTLIRIGLDNGQNWRDIVRWNAMDNPNQIEVGQVLRVTPPTGAAAGAPAGSQAAVVTRPVGSGSAVPAPVASAGQAAGGAGSPRPVVAAAGAASSPAPAPASAGPDEEIAWIWPTSGSVLAGFDEVKNKGLDIGGTAGTPVVAAADGRVVYVGAGLRGYGNLIILKHNNTYLTAYAHNQSLLVKEDQNVRKGQKIAEMGSSDADRVKLHFEVRRQGKPVDPAKYLPPR